MAQEVAGNKARSSGNQIIPHSFARINFGHPLARGIQRAWFFREGATDKIYDAVTGLRDTINGTLVKHPYGLESDDTTTSNHVTIDNILPLDSNNFTLVLRVIFTQNTAGTHGRIFSPYGEDGPTIWRSSGGGSINLVHTNTIDLSDSIGFNVDGNYSYYIAISRSSGYCFINRDGRIGASSTSFSVSYTNGTGKIMVRSNDTEKVPGIYQLAMVWKRGLTFEETNRIMIDPYQILQKNQYFGKSVAAAVSPAAFMRNNQMIGGVYV